MTAEEAAEASDAKKARKMMDLEITNRSLLAINSGLEVAKLQQAREIRELKRRVREGRGPSMRGSALPASLAVEGDVEDEEEDLEDEDTDFTPREDPELEALHQRCKGLIDHMIVQCRDAILYKYEFAKEGVGGKVLHPVELELMEQERRQSSTSAAGDVTTTSTAAGEDEESMITDDSAMLSSASSSRATSVDPDRDGRSSTPPPESLANLEIGSKEGLVAEEASTDAHSDAGTETARPTLDTSKVDISID